MVVSQPTLPVREATCSSSHPPQLPRAPPRSSDNGSGTSDGVSNNSSTAGRIIHTEEVGSNHETPPQQSSQHTSGSIHNENTTDENNDEENEEEDNSSSTSQNSQSSSSRSDSVEPSQHDDNQDKGEGRELSAYEKLRLERIKRNQQYLARLGLEEQSGIIKEMKKRRATDDMNNSKQKRKRELEITETRSSSRTRKLVNYADPPTSVASIIRSQKTEAGMTEKVSNQMEIRKKPKSQKRIAMERVIYREFQKIKSERSLFFRKAEKLKKAAEKEFKYWSRRAQLWERREERRKLLESIRKQLEEEKSRFGGHSLLDLVREIDKRMPELLDAAAKYDEIFEAASQNRARKKAEVVLERKMLLLDALNRIPSVLKSCKALIDQVFLGRTPEDSNLVRRSTRSSLEAVHVMPSKESDKRKKWSGGPRMTHNHTRVDPTALDIPIGNEPLLHPEDESVYKAEEWVSPDFSKIVDRSWLESDELPSFRDMTKFVFQVGDTVLYYPIGHRLHLEKHPDLVGHQRQCPSRLPLWERASLEINRNPASSSTTSTECWWSQKWLDEVNDGTWGYPLLCRVEHTTAEFPPDPFSKQEKMMSPGGDVKIVYKSPKNSRFVKQVARTPLQLVMRLKPLTTVVPPLWFEENGPRDEESLALPPYFSVVTFPCDEKPFVIPFSWAYTTSHSYAPGSKVCPLFEKDPFNVQVREFHSIGDSYGSMRLHDKVAFLSSVVRCQSLASLRSYLERENSRSRYRIPMHDGMLICSFLRNFANEEPRHDLFDVSDDIRLVDLIRSTLPIWESVVTMPNAYNRVKLLFSPWELSPIRCKSYNNLTTTMFTLDNSIREKFELLIEDFIVSDPAAVLFEHPVSEEDAPSYNCAVPVGMCLTKILSRLKLSKDGLCYYRGVDAVRADVKVLLENCLLYNSPDSPVVHAAVAAVKRLSDSLARCAASHFDERAEATETTEKLCQSIRDSEYYPVEKGTLSNSNETMLFRTQFKGEVSRDWLIRLKASAEPWCPQAGDTVLYSRREHELFAKRQMCPLGDENSIVFINKLPRNDDTSWIPLQVVWTRVCYPYWDQQLANQSDTSRGFSVWLCMTVKFPSESTPWKFYWKPRHSQLSPSNLSNNGCCTRFQWEDSFIRPASQDPEVNEKDLYFRHIIRILDELKRRCSTGSLFFQLDTDLSKSDIKRGVKLSSRPSRLGSVESYRHLLLVNDDQSYAPNVATRGVTRHSFGSDDVRDALAETGFLPIWTKGKLVRDDQDLEKYSKVVALPELCLEFVVLRLRDGHYRHIIAIQNDIIESWITVIALHIANANFGRKTKISAKRVAMALCSDISAARTEVENGIDASVANSVIEREKSVVEQLRVVRELYALAVAATLHPYHLAGTLGLESPVRYRIESLCEKDPPHDPERAEARQTLSLLFAALDRDGAGKSTDRKELPDDELPTVTVRIRCKGLKDRKRKKMPIGNSVRACFFGKDVMVRIVCKGKTISNPRRLDSKPRLRFTKAIEQDQILVLPNDYAASDSLCRFLFGRPGRMQPCARCVAFKRSFFACRVRCRHSNIDFDWSSVFTSKRSIDGLINAVCPKDEISSNEIAQKSVEETPTAELATHDEKAEHMPRSVCDEERDPRELFAFAKETMEIAAALYEAASRSNSAPARLGKEFIASNFPVDPSDNHFVYCIVCGTGGDLICCDGCPNVLHSHCARLPQVPDGEWFCEECCMQGRGSEGDFKLINDSQQTTMLPFGRFNCDQCKLSDIKSRLQSLHASRPESHRRKLLLDAVEEGGRADDNSDAGSRSESLGVRSSILEEQEAGESDYRSNDSNSIGGLAKADCMSTGHRRKLLVIGSRNQSKAESANDISRSENFDHESHQLRRSTRKRVRADDLVNVSDHEGRKGLAISSSVAVSSTNAKIRGSRSRAEDPQNVKLQTESLKAISSSVVFNQTKEKEGLLEMCESLDMMIGRKYKSARKGSREMGFVARRPSRMVNLRKATKTANSSKEYLSPGKYATDVTFAV